MPAFKPILSELDLPRVGEGHERSVLDLKASLDLAKTANMAIDVAAFANHLGGTLIVGAREKDGRVDAYVPVPESEANKRKEAISQAVAQRCRPAPRLDAVILPHGNEFVLAVNVWPQLNPVVGVRVDSQKDSGGYGGKAWVFPVRTGTNAHYISPENLAMYMLPQVRRTAVLLSRITPGQRIRCIWIETGSTEVRTFNGFDEEANVVKLALVGETPREHWVALDGIVRVFQDVDHEWQLYFHEKYALYSVSKR